MEPHRREARSLRARAAAHDLVRQPVLSTAFALIGLPFWLLLGVFAGIVEIVPVIGPLVAGSLAVAVGLTIDWQHAAFAAIAVWGLRLLQDYVVGPHVFGRAVGLSPLIVLVTVSSVGLLFGGVYVLLSVPLAAVLATLADMFVLNRDPAKQEVPRILFPAKDAETEHCVAFHGSESGNGGADIRSSEEGVEEMADIHGFSDRVIDLAQRLEDVADAVNGRGIRRGAWGTAAPPPGDGSGSLCAGDERDVYAPREGRRRPGEDERFRAGTT